MPHPRELSLDSPVTALAGVGLERAGQLARLRIVSVRDLLLHRPRRYEDRRQFVRIVDLRLREPASARGRIVAQGLKHWRQGQKSMFEIVLDDGTARLHCRWWNLPFMEKFFGVGDDVMVYGKVASLKPRTMDHPETERVEAHEECSIHLDRIAPVYPLTEGLTQRWLRSLIWRALDRCGSQIEEPYPAAYAPELPTRALAVRRLHFPESENDREMARRRLALDEFVAFQLEIQSRRRRLRAAGPALPCGGDNHLIKPFLAQLGFTLTPAQTRVLREIRQDLRGCEPMRRLLQGDVGSGKTAVAACAALMTIESGHNVLLMAPTQILAEQHAGSFRGWWERLGLSVGLCTGDQKDLWPAGPASSPARRTPPGMLIIGTHALIETSFAVPNLGLVIIDEQHKFGVVQREMLVRKGHYPHLLVMTATPIPRTLALTVYGDLDTSVIDQLPPGRGRLRTFVRDGAQLPRVYSFVRQKLAEGRQAYLVYPRVEDSDLRTGMKAVRDEFEKLQHEFKPHRVGLLHGQLRAGEKEEVMEAFRANRVQILLATSIVEVGVDVPNATVMLVENAERFGLAQLHQLRGRIGRGAHQSFCILIANLKTFEAKERLRILEKTADGFQIAEADLRLRGPGELLGSEQSGLATFRFGDPGADLPLLDHARVMAARLLGGMPRPG